MGGVGRESARMKSVLISIRPCWCNLIASGQKTLEIRKSRPKIETPFKCFIYCTKETHGYPGIVSGNVIGEFVCDSIKGIDVPYPAFRDRLDKSILEQSCVEYYPLHRYAYHDNVYGWHISELKIYDKPKGLLEAFRIARPPQSWRYVEGGICGEV